MIEVHNLEKRFGIKPVLKGLNFQASSGEFVAILGPNGAGKTTFLRILASLSRPSSGKIRISGYPIPAQAGVVRSLIGVVTHQPLLYGDLSAEENLFFYGRMYDVAKLENRVCEVLQLVGLYNRRHDLVRTYSRGMQQRLTIGRAILHKPVVMLFDEPYTGLDQDAVIMLDGILRDIVASGHTVVMTSHDLSRAVELASRIDVLSRGLIAASVYKQDITQDRLVSFYRQAVAETNP